MAKAVFLHRADSIYDDVPEKHYDFPRQYLNSVNATIGDWVLYYEPVKAGARGYFAAAQLASVIEKPGVPGRYLGIIAPGSFISFYEAVPRLLNGRPLEAAPDGSPAKGGRQQLAVRRLPDSEFEQIARMGLPADLIEREEARYSTVSGLSETSEFFERPIIERLESRRYRDALFRSKVLDAYEDRCAISGMELRNGGGRPEVQAAHIKPVKHNGPDTVRNGLALSGTLHWMFDRGLIAIADDHSVLVSHNKVPAEVASRLILPGLRIRLPRNPRHRPHPEYLKFHREEVYGRVG